MNYDVIIIGAGPAGLSFARSLGDTHLKILLIEKSSLADLKDPQEDGREIALTHLSVKLMKKLGAWDRIEARSISPLKKPAFSMVTRPILSILPVPQKAWKP